MEYSSKPRVAELVRDAEGGMKEHYLNLVKGLIDSGMDIIALCGFSSKEKCKLKKWGAEVVPFVIGGRISPIKDIFATIRLVKVLKKYKVDIIHCHGFRAGVVGRIAALMAKCPCIYTMHNFLPMNLESRIRKIVAHMEKKLSKITRAIITVSYALKKEATETLGIHGDKVKVIYNGVLFPSALARSTLDKSKEDIRERWGIDKDKIIVGTVARLIPSKGMDILLEAAPLVIEKNPHVKFMIVGNGPEESILKDKAEKLKCNKDIIFIGYSEYIWYYYESFDIFVLPSLSEGLGISVLEAMIMGKPVIATRTGGIGEIVEHGRNGYLVTPGDSRELANAILYFLANPQIVEEYAGRGKMEIEKKFDLHTMIRETSQVIFEAITK